MRLLRLFLIITYVCIAKSITTLEEPENCGLNSNKRRDALGFSFSSGSIETEIRNVSTYEKNEDSAKKNNSKRKISILDYKCTFLVQNR